MTTAPDVHWESWRRLRDPAAFEALVRPEMGRALSFARSLGCSEADAEDVLQESLVRLAAERSEAPSRIGVRAWLYRTVRDRARSRRRSWWRRRNREARAARPEAAPPRTGDLEAREQVQQALDALPDAEREAVRLRYLQDLDYAEMAHVLGVSENACRTRVHRALETLKKRFGAGVATMVAAFPLPAHSEHLLREVLRDSAHAGGKATVAGGWKLAGAVAAAAGAVVMVAAMVVPGEPPLRGPRPPRSLARDDGPVFVKTERGSIEIPAGDGGPTGTRTAGPGTTAADSSGGTGGAPSSGPAFAGNERPPTAEDAVALLLKAAGTAWDRGWRASAAEVYGTILRIDPKEKTAAGRVNTPDRDPPGEVRDRAAFEELLTPASAAAAKILSGLGTALASSGDAKGARERWALALLVDDQDPAANEGLKNRKLDGTWFSPAREAHLRYEKQWTDFRQSLARANPGVRGSLRTTGIPGDAGVASCALETDDTFLETDLTVREAETLLGDIARVRKHVEHVMETRVSGAARRESGFRAFLFITAEVRFDRAVDAAQRIPHESKGAAKEKGAWVSPDAPLLVLAMARQPADAARTLAHAAAHGDVRTLFGRLDPWLEEALASLLSSPLREEALAGECDGTGVIPPDRAKGTPLDRVPGIVRNQVRRSRDTPLDDLVQCKADGMTEEQRIKAWSLVQYLVETGGGNARRFFAAAGTTTAKKKETAEKLLRTYRKEFNSWKDLDAAWRAWALDVYGR